MLRLFFQLINARAGIYCTYTLQDIHLSVMILCSDVILFECAYRALATMVVLVPADRACGH